MRLLKDLLEARYVGSKVLIVVDDSEAIHAEPFRGSIKSAAQTAYEKFDLWPGEEWSKPTIEELEDGIYINWEDGITYAVITSEKNMREFWPEAIQFLRN